MRLASIDSYLPYVGDLSQACIPLGFFTAFCLQHQLLSPDVEQMHRDTVIQCRLQEGPVSALFVALGAELEDRHLSPAGQALPIGHCPLTLIVTVSSLAKTAGRSKTIGRTINVWRMF